MLSSDDSVIPFTKERRDFELHGSDGQAGAKFTSTPGLHLLYGGAGTGKSLLGLALVHALTVKARWVFANEPGGNFYTNEELLNQITGTKPFVLVDSLSLYLMRANAASGGAAMRGGITTGLVDTLLQLDYHCLKASVVCVGIVNTTAAPIQMDDAITTGQMVPLLGELALKVRDRVNRSWRVVRLPKDSVNQASASLGYATHQAEAPGAEPPRTQHAELSALWANKE